MKIGHRDVVIEALGLVDRQYHRLAAAPRQLRHELILRRHARAAVHQHDQRSASAMARSVCATIRLSIIIGVLDQAAGVDDDAGHLGAPRETVLPVARQPGRSATSASRVPVMALNKVDLPTFGRPINATTGSTVPTVRRRSGGLAAASPRLSSPRPSAAWRRRRQRRSAARGTGHGRRGAAPGRAEGRQLAAVVQHDHRVARRHRRIGDANLATRSRATSSPVFLSSQCT
jgi:hypothetical protein